MGEFWRTGSSHCVFLGRCYSVTSHSVSDSCSNCWRMARLKYSHFLVCRCSFFCSACFCLMSFRHWCIFPVWRWQLQEGIFQPGWPQQLQHWKPFATGCAALSFVAGMVRWRLIAGLMNDWTNGCLNYSAWLALNGYVLIGAVRCWRCCCWC